METKRLKTQNLKTTLAAIKNKREKLQSKSNPQTNDKDNTQSKSMIDELI